MSDQINNLSIVVVGASGDLARKKIFPALFALYCQGFLPEGCNIFGFARTEFTNDNFRSWIAEHLTCRYVPDESCAEKMGAFLSHCFYTSGQYASADSFLDLYEAIRQTADAGTANRMFYLAIPSSIFSATTHAIGNAGFVSCGLDSAWSRVIIEKPFGRDRESSDLLTRQLTQVFTEDQTYRIDHYLGKEVIQNLMVLRFANQVFEPVWNRSCIARIHIEWKENIGIGDRGRYFDEYGIIRDVMQNHLVQILALTAMERPMDTGAEHVRDAKVQVLKSIPPLTLKDVVLGQYHSYREEESVAKDSRTPTYAEAVLRINNERWRGVPFMVSAGKGMDARVNEVRIRFQEAAENIFCESPRCLPSNELVIRVQPDEAIYLRVVNKVPGLEMELKETELNLRYALAFPQKIPDAYECLLLDVIHGDKSLFIRSDELAAAWDIFTPVLHEIEEKSIKPEPYRFGTPRPAAVSKPLGEAHNR